MIYYHVFGTAREKSLNGSQDNPIFWRTGIPVSWDKEPTLKPVGGINLFGQFWKIISKYGQQVSIFSIPENQYNSRYTGSIADTISLERTSKNYTYSGTVSEPKKLAYDVTVIDIIRVTDPVDFPDDPYPVNIPEFPIIPDKDYQTEIQFSNSLLENTEGAEQRIVEWSSPIRVFNLARTTLQSDDLNAILDFHEEMKGSKKDFLYRDLSDYQVKGLLSAATAATSLMGDLMVRNVIPNAALSIDGFGSTTNSGVIQANIPTGSTIERAYLYAVSVWDKSSVYGVTFNGNTLSLDSATILSQNNNLATTVLWDVTSIIASSFTGGLQNFTIVENGPPSPNLTNDGAVLVVAYSNPSTQGFTSVILDGELSTEGDTFQFNFASPYTGGDFLVSLASSHSHQPVLGQQQFTVIDVTTNSTNNRRLTTSAGGADDRTTGQTSADGSLITVGGIGDNPANPNPTIQPNPFGVGNPDDEYYNLALGNSASTTPFIQPGDTFLSLKTVNPSNDDNVFGMFITSKFNLTASTSPTEGIFSPEHNGVNTEFILIKTYSCGDNVHYRPILYPDIDNLKIYQGTTEIPPSEYIVAPGKIVFNNPPPSSPKLTWEGTFKVLCHFEEDKLDYQPITKNRDNAIFSIPKLILRESRIEPEIALLPSDVFSSDLNHDFNLNLTKRCTISPKFETNIISLSSGERKRFSRRNIPSDISSLQQRKTLSQKDIDYLIALWLCAKGSGATFRYPDLVNNLSILSRFNSVSLSYQNQSSLQIYSLGELQIRRFTEGIQQDSGLEDFFANPVLTLCYCVLIELTNGENLGYTNFSQDLKIGGVVFRAKQSLDPTAMEKRLGIQSDNQEYRGAFSDNIDENLLFSNKFREARIITAVVDWRNLPNSLLDLPDEQIQIGYVGEIKSLGGESYTLENLTGSSINLRQSRDQKTSPFCQWAFGQDNGDNSGCRKQVPFYETQVAGVNGRRDFEVWGEYQNLAWGKCTFTDGANKSATYAIYRTVSIFGGKTNIQLFTEASGPVATHDGVILTAGCDKTYNTCKNTWNNTINFGNIPSFGNFMPGNDFLLSSPKQS